MNALKTGLLMTLLFALFMGLGRIVGGPDGLIVGFALALAMNFVAYWFSDRLALAMSRAREVSESEAPDLHRIVADLSQRAALPMPRVCVIPSMQPNAFATGRNPSNAAVAVTEGLMRMMSTQELEGVIAHELAHIRNRDILISSVTATIVGAISFVTQMLHFRAIFGGRDSGGSANPLVALLAAVVFGIAATMVQLAISRSREYEADRIGAQISGDPLALASALRRIEGAAKRMPMQVNPATSHMYIVNPLGGDSLRSMAAMFRTHPRTEERVARLEALAHRGLMRS
ncbi:MAG TPA: zinc metalloprotease HtpX [Chthonomonadales bacterium]|nr:zinc metalloprotease HtpX [Chthonomonadales bacterium]